MSWSRRSWDPSAVGKRVWTLPAPWGTPASGMLRKQPRRPPPRTADSSHFAVTVMSQLRGGPPAAKAAHQPGSRGLSERGGCRPPTGGHFGKGSWQPRTRAERPLGDAGRVWARNHESQEKYASHPCLRICLSYRWCFELQTPFILASLRAWRERSVCGRSGQYLPSRE